MALQSWLNGDNFAVLRDKYNAVVTLLKGGAAGQKFVSTGGGDPQWVNDNSSIPSQTGNTGKYLTTDGTTPSWASIAIPTQKIIFLQGKKGSIEGSYPNSGPSGTGPSVIGQSIMLPNDAINRDCLINFTVDASGISTAPNAYIGVYKNNVVVKEFLFVVRTDYAASLIASGSLVEANCSPNDAFTLQLRINGSTSQITIHTYTLTLLGNPL